jgi:hypothetical protein
MDAVKRLPLSTRVSGVVCGRIKMKSTRTQVLVFTDADVVVYNGDQSVAWRASLVGLRAEKQALDSVRFVASQGDSIKFITSAIGRDRIIAHAETAARLATDTTPLYREPSYSLTVALARGLDLVESSQIALQVSHDEVRLLDAVTAEIVVEARGPDLWEFVASGPGEVTEGGGFFGGGFGVQGALKGMLITSALNELTTRTSVSSLLRIVTRSWSVVLVSDTLTPDQLNSMAPVTIPPGATPPAPEDASLDVQLANLARLHVQGALTDDEFAAAKRKLING